MYRQFSQGIAIAFMVALSSAQPAKAQALIPNQDRTSPHYVIGALFALRLAEQQWCEEPKLSYDEIIKMAERTNVTLRLIGKRFDEVARIQHPEIARGYEKTLAQLNIFFDQEFETRGRTIELCAIMPHYAYDLGYAH